MNLINVNNLTFSYGDDPVLKGLTFTVGEGDFLGIIGPNGSGKSTLLRLLANLLKPVTGSISIGERDLDEYSIKNLARVIAAVPEETLVNFPFTVEELVTMGRTPYLSFLESFTVHDREIASEAMQRTGILHLRHRYINEISSGERQRAFIAQALAQETRIVILDEPTAHLDINHQTEIFDLLKNLQVYNRLTILVVSHDLNLAALYCEKLLLMKAGALFALGTPAEVITERNLGEVYNSQVMVTENPAAKKPQISLIPKI
jgi:iron complex transport system ATP-binding protein